MIVFKCGKVKISSGISSRRRRHSALRGGIRRSELQSWMSLSGRCCPRGRADEEGGGAGLRDARMAACKAGENGGVRRGR